jgi:hypothetical protein
MKHPRMIDRRMIFALLASLLALRTITGESNVSALPDALLLLSPPQFRCSTIAGRKCY